MSPATMKYDHQVIISDTNRTPIIQIVAWLCLVTSLLAFLTHAGIKFYVFRSLRLESWLVLVSLVFCILQTVAVLLQCSYGYGTPLATLSEDSLQVIFKSEYAAIIAFFFSLGFSKLAVGAFIHNLTPSKLHRNINYGICTVICLWMVSAILSAAFQCGLPRPWDLRTTCFDLYTWWNTEAAINIITEVAIVSLELGITARLHVDRRRKAAVMSLFGCRSLVLITTAIQLAYYHQESNDPTYKSDLTLGYWRSATCTQILQCLAIVTTCLPYTKIFMEGFESGLLRLDDMRRRGEHTSQGYSGGYSGNSGRAYQLMDVSRSTQDKKINVSRSWAVEVEPATATDLDPTGSSSSSTNLRPDGVATTVRVQ